MQQKLSKKNVIVTEWPFKKKVSFNKDSLKKIAGTQSWQISINGNIHIVNFSLNSLYVYFADYSIKPPGNDCGPTVVSGRVQDIWDNRHPSGKILNALDFLLYNSNTEPTKYASDLHTWLVVHSDNVWRMQSNAMPSIYDMRVYLW